MLKYIDQYWTLFYATISIFINNLKVIIFHLLLTQNIKLLCIFFIVIPTEPGCFL